MGKSSPSTPAAPNPAATAAAQTATNKETAYWNAVLNNVNQVTPYGNLTYKQTGGGPQYNNEAYAKALEAYNTAPASGGQAMYIGLDGKVTPYETYGSRLVSGTPGSTAKGAMPKLEDFKMGESPPQFTSTIDLSPEQQAILDRTTANQKALVDLGGQQLGRISESVNTPFSFSGLPSYGEADQNAAAAKGEEALLGRLNPQFARDEEALRSRLINQGIGQGSQAYNTEMERFNQAKNDARQQAVLGGQQYGSAELASALQRRNQGIQEYTTTRNAPLNEYIGLTSGVQVQNPSFTSQNYQGTQPVDYANMVNQNYQNQIGQYNQKVASNNSTTSGILGLAGQLGGSFLGGGGLFSLSDSRLKVNIKRVGMEKGHKIYEFAYKWAPKKRFKGVMAQDVVESHPHAIKVVNGFMAVDYDAIGLKMEEVA